MSASRERKKRMTAEQPAAQPATAKKKKLPEALIFVVSIVLVLAIVFGSIAIYRAHWRNATVVTVGEHEVSTVEFNYFLNNVVSDLVNSYGSYLSIIGLDPSVRLTEQNVPNTDKNAEPQTWAAYLADSAKTMAVNYYTVCDEAAKNGYELTQEQLDTIESQITTVSAYAKLYSVSADTYIENMFGKGCDVDSYRDFLNHGITPRIPRRGAVGEADITTITHIGLAFIGEEDVNYKGEVVSAKEAMEKEGLKPLHLQLKDTHTIMLSNSQGEGTAAILVHEVENLVKMSDRIFCLDYEGLNGNIEPMREDVNELRGLPGQIRCAARCREDLEGSYLYSDNRPEHALQDPLTFRSGFIITGAVEDALDYVKKFLSIQINSPSDNPCIMLDKKDVFVNSNFETTSLVIGVEMLAIALAHLSRAVNYRLIRMCMPEFTHLPRFLAPRNGSAHGYDEALLDRLFDTNLMELLDAVERGGR